MSKQKLTAEEKAAKKAEFKAKFKAMNKKNSTKWQAVKYALCTASAGLIEFITFTIFINVLPIDHSRTINFIQELPLLNFVSTLISLTLSILWNFTVNRKFTFKAAGNVPRAMFLAFLFYVPFFPFKLWFNGYMPGYMVAGAAASAGISVALYLKEHQIVTLLVEVITMLLNGVLEFCWQKFVIYRKSENSAGAVKIADNARLVETTAYNPLNGKEFGSDTFAAEDMEIVENELNNVGIDK